MNHKEIIDQLKQPFPVAAHKERKLPGGGRWFYIPWQAIRDRLDEVYPEWEVSYSQPGYLGDFCYITCTITIGKISRSAPGNAPIEAKGWGTPIENAIADAYKNASEAWGIGRYLDDQAFVIKYMQSRGDGRAYKFATENGQLEAGARGTPKLPTPNKKESDSKPPLSLVPNIDRNLVNSEIDSIIKRKDISLDEAKETLNQRYNARSRSQLTDSQLVEFLELLRLKPSQSVI